MGYTLDDEGLSGGLRSIGASPRACSPTLGELFDRDRIVPRRIDNRVCGQDYRIDRQRTRDCYAVGHDSHYLVVTHAQVLEHYKVQ
jgi:hypothetical protein